MSWQLWCLVDIARMPTVLDREVRDVGMAWNSERNGPHRRPVLEQLGSLHHTGN